MTLSLTYKGFDYPAFVDGSYADNDSLPSLLTTHANSVALSLDYGIDTTTNTIVFDSTYTDSLADLGATITEAENDGLNVMVRPLIDNLTQSSLGLDTWRAYYVPPADKVAAFFASYQTMLVNEATIAQAHGAQLFDIGTEMDQLTGPAYTSYWNSIISAVRAVFTGKLTYSAIWADNLSPWQGGPPPAGTGNIETQISFWSKLDYIGIDEYAPISDDANPTLQDLINGWTKAPTDATVSAVTGGLSLIDYYEKLSSDLGKPLLFTEIGYESANDAASSPFFTQTGTADAALQNLLYEAFFDAWKESGNADLNGVYIWDWDANTSEVGPGNEPDFSPQGLAAQGTITSAFAACYAAGTRIATACGEVPVQALRVGDAVRLARGGTAPVRWLGHRRVDCARHPRPWDVLPVRVRAGAFGTGKPARDLVLSPDHAVFANGVLVPVRYLVNGATIVQESAAAIEYWHVELPAHDVILAEGLPAESFLDTGNRDAFANGGAAVAMHPDFARGVWQAQGCAPLVTQGEPLLAVRRRLQRRLHALGYIRARGAVLSVHAGDRSLPVVRQNGCVRVSLPADTAEVRLASPTAVPAEAELAATDHRRLGVAVAGLWLDRRAVALDDPRCGTGWHHVEDTWRWTDGDAVLDVRGARSLTIRVAFSARPWLSPAEAPAEATAEPALAL